VQFLAFLRDSYREARNGWMLQIMLGLATLLILLVASIGYRPITLQTRLDQEFKGLRWLLSLDPKGFERLGRPEIGVENFESTNATEPWRADYSFDYYTRVADGADIREIQEAGIPLGRDRVRDLFRRELSREYDSVEVTGGPPELEPRPKAKGKDDEDTKAKTKKDGGPLPPPEARYRVAVKGSKVDDPLAWPHQVTALFVLDVPGFHIPLRQGVYVVENNLVSGIGAWVALLVAVIITAGFIPTMLAKGSLDLIVSKPVGRPRLLLYKYLGGLTFILLLTAYAATGVWVATGVRTGIWAPNFLLVIPILTFYFAVLYSVSTLAAVLTRSTIVAILATGLAWALLWGIGKVNDGIEDRREAEAKDAAGELPKNPADIARRADPNAPLWFVIPKASFPVFTAIHAVSPRTYQLDERLGRVIAEGVLTPNQLKTQGYDAPPRASWAEMLGVSAGFIAVVLGLACWRFSARDY
jgi:hypothetical protein